ncbi:MAG: hypothetical protein V4594_14845 [Bacteroidota bacterium]
MIELDSIELFPYTGLRKTFLVKGEADNRKSYEGLTRWYGSNLDTAFNCMRRTYF